ncbi:MAG: neutral/alkaline non-lysosomal ceramidase N-terminal domain-containing protein [Candidatus Zipacnadales bacterium]
MSTVGFAHVDITPPIGCAMQGYAMREHPALGVADPLYGRAMVIESAGERLAIVGTDLIGVTGELTAAVREIVERECGITGEAVLVSGSHTHWGPALWPPGYLPEHLERTFRPEYTEELALKLAMAVVLADRRRQPAKIGGGSGWNPLISYNRRPIDQVGHCHTSFQVPPPLAAWAAAEGARQAAEALGLNEGGLASSRPLPKRPEDELGSLTWGPTDPQVPVLRVEGERGALGGVVSFACHPVCGAGQESFYDLSADYPGVLQQVLTCVLGCSVVFLLGCAGNQVPVQRGPGSRKRIGGSLAGEVLRIWESIDIQDEVPLRATRIEFDLPIKDFANLERPLGDDSHARYIRHLIAKYAGQTHVPTEVQALRIGPVGLVSLPGEIFVELGHEIKRRSPFEITMPVTVANGSLGYIGTLESYCQGGYEVTWNIAAPEAGQILVENAVEALKRVA